MIPSTDTILLTSIVADIFDNKLFGLTVAIAAGIVLPYIWNKFIYCFKQNQKKRKSQIVQSYSFSKQASANEDYTPIIGSNDFLEDGFDTSVADESYIRLIPDTGSRRKKLNKLHFGDDQTIGKSFTRQKQNLKTLIQTYFSVYIEDTEAFLETIANKTADNFITDLKASKLRYNKGLLGVHAIDDKQRIELYNSDYFTFKFTVNTYNALTQIAKENNLQTPLAKYDTYQDIENLVPFLNSIGVGGFIIMNRGKGDELLFGWRDSRSCESGGYWHFTYDETYTQDDIPKDTNGKSGLITCLKRALYEELGIDEKQLDLCVNPHQMGVINAGIIHTGGNDNRFEFEVCSFVRVCLSNKFTIDDFIKCYQFAKDAAIETSNLHFVPINELDKFCKENILSPEARHLAFQLKIRIEQGIIKSDHDCYEEILKKRMPLSF